MTQTKASPDERIPYPELSFRQRMHLKAIARAQGITEDEARKQLMDGALNDAMNRAFYSRPSTLQ